jgi:hypothetical protein
MHTSSIHGLQLILFIYSYGMYVLSCKRLIDTIYSHKQQKGTKRSSETVPPSLLLASLILASVILQLIRVELLHDMRILRTAAATSRTSLIHIATPTMDSYHVHHWSTISFQQVSIPSNLLL